MSRRAQPSDFENDDVDDDMRAHEQEHDEDTPFPIFFPPSFRQTLVRSRKSLTLLRIAQPKHSLLKTSDTARIPIRWMWTNADIEAAWQGSGLEIIDLTENSEGHSPEPSTRTSSPDTSSKYGIKEFARFDLEPGTGLFAQEQGLAEISSPRNFRSFLVSFPSRISSLTPSLSNLVELVESLSTALVETFLSDASGYLSFQRHMVLLRSYLLLMSPTFKSKLQTALFSDSPDGKDRRLMTRRMAGSKRSDNLDASDTWVIGLASPLTESNHWPPTGADLSYLLRTVIIDSLDDECPGRQIEKGRTSSEEQDASLIYQEADWRLGFAVRDLPVGSGQAKWLNPRSTLAMIC